MYVLSEQLMKVQGPKHCVNGLCNIDKLAGTRLMDYILVRKVKVTTQLKILHSGMTGLHSLNQT